MAPLPLLQRLVRAAASEGGVIFTLGFTFGFPFGFYSDLAWQLAEGRALWSGHFPRELPEAIAAGAWIDHEWLFEAAAWPWWAHGVFPVFAIACDALVASVPLIVRAIAARCGASPYVANAVGYISIPAVVTSYAVRPQSVAEVCFALELLLLLGGLRRGWLLLPLTVLWANTHGSAALAPALAVLVGAGRRFAGTDAPSGRAFGVALAWTLLGTLLTPQGVAIFGAAGGTLGNADIQTTLDWKPASVADPVAAVCIALVFGALVLGGVPAERRNGVALLLLAVFTPLWLAHTRFLPFFGIAAAPALAVALGRTGFEHRPGRRARVAGGQSGLLAAPIVATVALVAVAGAPFATHVSADLLSVDALVRRAHFTGHLDALFEAGGYLQLRQEPVRVLLDSHALPFSHDAWTAYLVIHDARPGWREALDRWAIRGVCEREDTAIVAALRTTPGWHEAGRDGAYTLMVRDERGAAGRSVER